MEPGSPDPGSEPPLTPEAAAARLNLGLDVVLRADQLPSFARKHAHFVGNSPAAEVNGIRALRRKAYRGGGRLTVREALLWLMQYRTRGVDGDSPDLQLGVRGREAAELSIGDSAAAAAARAAHPPGKKMRARVRTQPRG